MQRLLCRHRAMPAAFLLIDLGGAAPARRCRCPYALPAGQCAGAHPRTLVAGQARRGRTIKPPRAGLPAGESSSAGQAATSTRPSGRLQQLAAELKELMQALGFEPEGRPYSPHLTLARVKREGDERGLRDLLSSLKPAAVTQSVEQFNLMQSILGRAGPAHESLAEFHLGKSR